MLSIPCFNQPTMIRIVGVDGQGAFTRTLLKFELVAQILDDELSLRIAWLYHKTRGLQLLTPRTHGFMAGLRFRDMKDWEILRSIEYFRRGNANTA